MDAESVIQTPFVTTIPPPSEIIYNFVTIQSRIGGLPVDSMAVVYIPTETSSAKMHSDTSININNCTHSQLSMVGIGWSACVAFPNAKKHGKLPFVAADRQRLLL